MRNTNRLIAYIYSILVNINNNWNGPRDKCFYMLADCGCQEVDVIIWEFIKTDSSGSKHGSCCLILEPNAFYE